ncbi:MAG: hypothetical protein EON96_06410 [Caulobacteraceae bacterium]|nr:MAG: hypothetical protein EON96_06410 [Caulobacteraceae bacterium]
MIVSDPATMNNLRTHLAGTAGQRFRQSVDMVVGGTNLYGMQAWHIALMGQITGDPRYCEHAVAKAERFVRAEKELIDAIAARPGPLPTSRAEVGIPVVAYDSYLHIGEHVGNLALVYDWCRSAMTTDQRTRWKDYANQAVWNVWNHREETWGGRRLGQAAWSGWSVDNPVNNYYYSFLNATMLLGLVTHGENGMAGEWLNKFRIEKVENQMIPTFNRDLVGGGSREGTGYGTAMMNLWELYDWWERSTGESLADRSPHALASMAWMVHSITPTLDRIAPIGDHSRDREALLFDYHRDYLQKLVSLYPDERLSGSVKTLLGQSSVRQVGQHFMRYSDYLYDMAPIAARPLADLSTAYWASGTGVFAMRSDWTTTASYANLMCGTRTESHAHSDQGNFMLFKGAWLAYDANINGNNGLLQDQAVHNTVRFEVGQESVGQIYDGPCVMDALADTTRWTYAMMDSTRVYPANSGVTKSEREFVFIKPSTFIIYDRAQTASANSRRMFTINFPAMPIVNGENTSLTAGGHRLQMERLSPVAATTNVALWRTIMPSRFPGDANPATRMDVIDATGGTRSDFLHVIGLDGAFTRAERSDAGGQIGATVTLADGRVAIVRFNQNSQGGTIEIRSSTGAVLESRALPTTVTTPPLYAN